MTPTNAPKNTNPRVLIYFCNSCSGPSASRDGLSLAHISDSITSVHFKCARDVTPEQIRRGFANGADGILICGCLVRNCENSPNDLKVLQDLFRNQLAIKELGLASDRLREDWVVQGTTDHLERIVAEFVEHLRELGPLHKQTTSGPLKIKEGQA
ncbi:MAG: hydrogenase iron-sulfur subunit [Candidatus Krumholzibacteria bacterium]|nr:hydrogenase iron-sulfur subunit [Candidatus Krumholzibacteria bacterium]